MTVALASLPELEDHLGRELSDTELAQADALLVRASARVITYTGQQFLAATSTAQVKVRNQIARLPQRPVTAVSAVVDLDGNAPTFTWLNDDRVRLGNRFANDTFEVDRWANRILEVRITYDHGYDEAPDDVKAVVCQMVGRALGRPADAAAVTQESIAGYSYSVGGAAAAGAVGMMADEKAALDVYRRIGTSARIGP